VLRGSKVACTQLAGKDQAETVRVGNCQKAFQK